MITQPTPIISATQTYTFTVSGVTSGNNYSAECFRFGDRLFVTGKFIAVAVSAVELQFPLKFNSAAVTANVVTGNPQDCGFWNTNNGQSGYIVNKGQNYVGFCTAGNGNNTILGSSLTVTCTVHFQFHVPIIGWTLYT